MKTKSISAKLCAGVLCVSVATSMSPTAALALAAVVQGDPGDLYSASALNGESDESDAGEELFDLSQLGSDDWSTLWLDENLEAPNIGRHYFVNETTYTGRWLTQGTDFEVLGWCEFQNGYVLLEAAPSTAGTYYLKVQGIGGYAGITYAGVQLVDPGNIAHYSVSALSNVWLDDPSLPAVSVARMKNGESVNLQADDYTVDGWYSRSAEGAYTAVTPAEAGDYYLRVSGGSQSVTGEVYVCVNIRNRYELSNYYTWIPETLWTDEVPALDEICVEASTSSSSGRICLEQGKDFKATGWYSYDASAADPYALLSSVPQEAGIYYLRIDGCEPYSGTKYLRAQVLDSRDLAQYSAYATDVLWVDSLPGLEEMPLEVCRWVDSEKVLLKQGEDYEVAGWYSYDENASEHYVSLPNGPQERGTYYLKLEGIGSCSGSKYCSVFVRDSHNLVECGAYFDEALWDDGDLSLENLPLDVYTFYNDLGERVTLERGRDYVIEGWYTYTYDDEYQRLDGTPASAGTYYVKLRGIGDYRGEKIASAQVRDHLDIANCSATAKRDLWLDELDCPDVGLFLYRNNRREDLSKDVDYIFSGWFTRNNGSYVPLDGSPQTEGTYYLRADGVGQYKGTQYIRLSVEDRYNIANYGFGLRDSLWDDKEIPEASAASVRCHNSSLTAGEDYEVVSWCTYENGDYADLGDKPNSAGTYYLKIAGRGDYHGYCYECVKVRDSKDLDNYYVSRPWRFWLTDDKDLVALSIKVYRDYDYDADERDMLERGKDYEVEGWFTYEEGEYKPLDGNPTVAGTYYLKIAAKDPYKGEKYASVSVQDWYALSSHEFCSSGSLWDDSDFSRPASSFVEEYDSDHLAEGEDYSVAGWYIRSGDAYTRLAGAPTEAGDYYLKVEGIAPFTGEEYVRVRVRDHLDVESYGTFFDDSLWSDYDLSVDGLSVDLYRYDYLSGKKTSLERDEDYKVLGWYTYDYDSEGDCEPIDGVPTAAGDYTLKVEGTGNYYGEKYVYAYVKDARNVGCYSADFADTLWTDGDLSLRSLPLEVYRYNRNTDLMQYLELGSDYEIEGWYPYDYDDDSDVVDGLPAAAGEYVLRIKGIGDTYYGEKDICVEVKDPSYLSGYSIDIEDELVLGADLSDPNLTVYRQNPTTGQEERLVRGVDYEVDGWLERYNDDAQIVASPTCPGVWTLRLRGLGKYEGYKFINIEFEDSSSSGGGSSSGGSGSTTPSAPVTPGESTTPTEPAEPVEPAAPAVGDVLEGVSLGDLDADTSSATTADITITSTASVVDSQGNAVAGTVSIGNIISTCVEVVIPETITVGGATYLVTEIPAAAMKGNSTAVNVSIPSSVTAIGASAFEGCTALESVSIPTSVTVIGEAAFRGCTSLASVVIPTGVETIGASAFEGCSSLESANIPANATVGARAFAESGLTSVTIAKGVELGRGVFRDCTKLKSATVKAGTLPAYAFKGCTALRSVVLSKNVIAIGRSAFSGCKSLRNVVIPSSVEKIGKYAFYGAGKVTSLTVKSTKLTKRSVRDALKGSNVTTVKVPNKVLEEYGKVFAKGNVGKKIAVKKIG